jgi:signal transduction histidine kinase
MLPDVEGIEVGRRLRERGFKTAVLFLTAKDATENKVEALRAGGGVGLGLSIVAAVAEAHGGEVSARSEPGKDSTFRITLPLAS